MIEISDNKLWQCSNCDSYNNELLIKCEKCETKKPKSAASVSEYSLNSNECLNFLKDKMGLILSNTTWSISDMKQKPYPQFKIMNKDKYDEEILVIFTTHEVMPKDIKQLKLEAKPTIFILPSDRPSIETKIKNEELFFNIPFELMLAYDEQNTEKEFLNKNILEKLEFVYKQACLLSNIAANSSFSRLQNTVEVYKEYKQKGDIFELDVFNIMRKIFPSAIQLGARKKGKRVADGYFDIHVLNGGGIQDSFKGTMLWDAKYSEDSKGYDFNIDEKRKITEYINKNNKDYEILNYSSQKRLDCFLIISNNFRESQFDEIGKFVVENTTNWNGNLIFLDLESILELVKYVSSPDYTTKVNLFKNIICSDLFKINDFDSRQNYIHINKDKVLNLITKLKRYTSTQTSISDKVLINNE